MKIKYKTQNWYCECCGSGAHWEIDIFNESGDQVWGTSRNDQFGGIYRDNDLMISISDPEQFVDGLASVFTSLGYTVVVDSDIDCSTPWEDFVEGDEE